MTVKHSWNGDGNIRTKSLQLYLMRNLVDTQTIVKVLDEFDTSRSGSIKLVSPRLVE